MISTLHAKKLAPDAAILAGDAQSRVHDALRAGRPQEAAQILGCYWAFQGPVMHGDARGRTMGFPTANMHFAADVPPAFGVYAVRVDILHGDFSARPFDGVASFGIRPMFRTATPLLETHLFNFDGDLYGKILSVELVAWMRPEQKFSGMEALIAQISEDSCNARAILKTAHGFSPRPGAPRS